MLAFDASPNATFAGRGEGMYILAEQIAKEGPSTSFSSHPIASAFAAANTFSTHGVPLLQGRYRILRKIGEGGMGVVYEAEQIRPRRIVALKAIRTGSTSRESLRRFEYEAHVLGRLQHPNIAQIYDAGAADEAMEDQAFFAMEFVNGLPLTDHAKVNMLAVRDKLNLMCKVCDAMHHAHQRGVIHRDLKPSNILVNETGEPKILDFGVAHAENDPLLTTMHTIPGQLVGTLAYMSPEQVLGDAGKVDSGTDIYALGVILYQLLTGEPPHDLVRCSLPRAAQIIRDETPKSLSSHIRALRGDLELIVKTAMAKDRKDRYQSAAELADDIRRFLDGRPVLARQESAIDVLGRQVRRYRTGVGLGLAACVVLLAAALYGFVQREREHAANQAAMQALALAEEAEARANHEAESLRESLYRSTIGFAHAAYLNKNLGRMRQLLASAPQDLRHWEWHYLQGLTDASLRSVKAHDPANCRMSVALDAPVAVTMSQIGEVRAWDLRTGDSTSLCTRGGLDPWLAIHPQGTIAAIGAGQEIELIEIATCRAKAVARLDIAFIGSAAFSPSGDHLAFIGSELVVYETQQLTNPIWRIEGRSAFRALSWSFDGTMLAVGTMDGQIMVFDGSSGDLLWTRQGHSQMVRTLAFHPDGNRLATGGNDTLLHVWDIPTGNRIATLQPHDNKVNVAVYSLDGQHLFSGSSDSSIQITDSHNFERIGQFVGHEWTILELGISRAHNELISLCRGGEVRWWPISDFNITNHRIMVGGSVSALAINADATKMGFSNYQQRLTVIDTATRSTLWSVPDVGAVVGGLLFDRERLFVSCYDRHVRGYNSETGKLLWMSTQFAAAPTRSALSLDGRVLAVGCRGGYVHLLESETGATLGVMGEGQSMVLDLQWINDRDLILGDKRGQLAWWNCKDRVLLSKQQVHNDAVYRIALLDNGSSCVTAGEDGLMRIWRLDPFNLEAEFKGHHGAIYAMRVSPDGTRIATGGFDNMIRLWDRARTDELLTLTGHIMSVTELCFSPDGSTLLSANDDGTIRWWHASNP